MQCTVYPPSTYYRAQWTEANIPEETSWRRGAMGSAKTGTGLGV